MKHKKDPQYLNNKKTLHAAVVRAAAVHKAFMRDDRIELPHHPGQMSMIGMLFPVFDSEVIDNEIN